MTKADAIDPAKIIDFSALKDNVKNIINAAKTVNIPNNATKAEVKETATTAKAASKVVLKEMAQAVANLVNSKIPALPALALKAEWKDNNVGTRNVISDYSLAATAYKPLSFNFGKAEGEIVPTISLDRVDNAIFKFAEKIKSVLNGVNIKDVEISKINFTETELANFDKSQYVWIKITETYGATGGWLNGQLQNVVVDLTTSKTNEAPDGYSASDTRNALGNGTVVIVTNTKINADMKSAIETIKTKINGTLNGANSDIAEMLDQVKDYINKAKKATTKAADLADRATDYLQNYMNRAINFVNNGGISRALEPILLVNTENGICRATGAYKAGEFTFVPTTVTYEIAAPAFKKYIAVIGKDGKARAADAKLLTKGDNNFSAVKLNLQQGDTKIVYDAMDFTGRHIIKVYDITVE